MQIRINTPKVQSDEALAQIQQMLHWMERIGRLRHGVMVPPGADVKKMNEGDELWQPWTSEERSYFRGVRTIFAHARCTVLGNGDLRVRDRSPFRPGKPDIDGLHFDKETTDWEWDAQEFQDFAQRLKALVLERFQFYHIATVTCQTCGQSVNGTDYLTCGHVEYSERSDGSVIARKPRGATLGVTASIGYRDDMKEDLDGTAMKGVVTYDGLDLIISSMESADAIAIEAEKRGTPIYVVGKEEEKEEG